MPIADKADIVYRPLSLKHWLKNICYTASMVYKEREKKTNLSMKALTLKGIVNCWYLHGNSNLYEPSLNKKLLQTSYSNDGFWGCFIVFLVTYEATWSQTDGQVCKHKVHLQQGGGHKHHFLQGCVPKAQTLTNMEGVPSTYTWR